ncbi:MAG: hypothetical protein JWN93_418 [Hyphomicrobiales bacterium]|nr:hypothetical protein [Hyphomicrobiales bacterium]
MSIAKAGLIALCLTTGCAVASFAQTPGPTRDSTVEGDQKLNTTAPPGLPAGAQNMTDAERQRTQSMQDRTLTNRAAGSTAPTTGTIPTVRDRQDQRTNDNKDDTTDYGKATPSPGAR